MDRGRNLPISLPRRWIGDMLHFASRVPTVAGHRTLRIRSLLEARRKIPGAPTWQALVIKALSIASMRVPEMRRCFMPFPWDHLYEAPYPVASIVFDREFRGEPAMFMAPMLYPDRLPLQKIAEKVQAWKVDPIENHGPLRRLVRNAKPPKFIRRTLWWIGLNGSGFLRARMFGTFAVNSIAALRGHMTQFVCPLTSVWYYGVVNPRGEMDLRTAFDHRVFDGIIVGRAGSEVENIMNTVLLEEIRSGGSSASSPLDNTENPDLPSGEQPDSTAA